MRLAVVTKYPPRSEGISDYARHVVRRLGEAPEVERITVLANRAASASSLSSSGVDLRRVWQPNDPSLVGRVLGEILRFRPDAIWYNVGLTMFGDRPTAMLGFLLPAITRRWARSIVTLHERPIERLGELGAPDGTLRRFGLDLATRWLLDSHVVCVTTRQHLHALEARAPRGRAKRQYLPLCGYAEPVLEPLQEAATALILTSHAPHKNLPLLLDAFRQVRARRPAARLLVAGIDHPRFPGYLASVRRRYLDVPGVEWIGEVSDDAVRATFCRAAVTIAPYRVATGSSATVHQAVSVGRPVIVTDLPEFRAVAEEEDLWLEFFPRDDASSLAAALDRLLREPERGQAMARHNLRSARRNSLSETSARYLQLFRARPREEALLTVSATASGGPWP